MKKISVTYLLLFLAVAFATAQSSVDSVALRAMQVGRVMQQERVYLHFDNTAYYLGETMWFKAYVSFGNDNRPSTLSKVLYVELVAPEGYVVETKKYKLDDNGCCNGEFELVPLMLSGYYEVRAYTRYMLNWGKDAVFSRVFPVFDKVNADNWEFKNMLDRRRAFFQDGKWHSSELPDYTLDFYPESGHLVNGLPSRVAFELREHDGLFSESEIKLFKSDVLVANATPVHLGKGLFEFTPESGSKYHAEVVVSNDKGKAKKYTFKLPEVSDEGAVMRVDEISDSIRLCIWNNFSESRELGFVLLHRGTMGFYRKLSSEKRADTILIPKSELPEGVNRAVLFVDDDTPLAERQFFVVHDSLYYGTQERVGLRVLANGYHLQNLTPSQGEKIRLEVVRDDGKPISPNTVLSLSVNDAQGKQTTSYSHNIYTYMLLGSELKGYLPDAMQYFDPSNNRRKEQLDLVMLTHGWTSYSWQNLSRKKIDKFQPIERGITLKGTFLQKRNDRRFGHLGEVILTPQAYNLVRLDIATDGKNGIMSTFRTDSVGEFVLELDEFYGTRVASLKPQTTFKQSRDISYTFALDRYFSPGFRLYDYWERHAGNIMSKAEADSLVRLNPFEYMLSSVEVVSKRKKEINARPPHSEMRLNYLDEWEYALDVTYLNMLEKHRDELYNAVLNDATMPSISGKFDVNGEKYDSVSYESGDVITLYTEKSINRYIGHVYYSNDSEAGDMPIDHEYDHVLTAEDVVSSAIKRHGYYWAYWIQLMVVDGKYSSFEVPKLDMEYLRGTPDVEKMTNFKEIVIRSDEKTRAQFENRENRWEPLTFMLNNKVPLRKFYMGFLSQSYVYPQYEVDDCPNVHRFEKVLRGGEGIYYPINPNYVACMIPYTSEEQDSCYVPEYASTGSAMRYTSVQGYSESKQFYSPDYSHMTPQQGDYRRTLLWTPTVNIDSDGKAFVELYNSSVCTELNVSVEGRNGDVLFSNGGILPTMVGENEQQHKHVVESKVPEIIVAPMDSVLKAQCAHEHEKGVVYYNQQRYKDAIMIFAELVQYKYAPSLYYVAISYRDGTGVKQNDKLSFSFMLEAAKRNEPKAQYEVAVLYNEGTVVGRDSVSALQWLKMAVANEEPRALYDMALRCFDGNGVEQDNESGAMYLKRAAMLKNPDALYMYGKRLVAEGADGVRYIRNAANLNHIEAIFYMSDYAHNAGNYKDAFKYAKHLSLLGYHEGTKRVADYYLEGKWVKRDKKTAKDLYRDAAAAGNKEAQSILMGL